jgi:hypothetical protein
VAAVEAGGKVKFVKFSAEDFVFLTAPNFGQRCFLDVSEGAVGDFPANIVHMGIAALENGRPQTTGGKSIGVRLATGKIFLPWKVPAPGRMPTGKPIKRRKTEL